MNRVIDKIIPGMAALLWLYPVAAGWMFVSQGRSAVSAWPCALLPLVVTLLVLGFSRFLKSGFPHEEDYPVARKVLLLILLLLYCVAGASLFMIGSADPASVPFEKISCIGFGIFFILLGTLLPKLHRNRLIGVRFSWTMTDEEVWRKVHYWAGREAIVAGALIIAASFLFPLGPVRLLRPVIALLIFWAVGSSVHSWFIARRMNRTKR